MPLFLSVYFTWSLDGLKSCGCFGSNIPHGYFGELRRGYKRGSPSVLPSNVRRSYFCIYLPVGYLLIEGKSRKLKFGSICSLNVTKTNKCVMKCLLSRGIFVFNIFASLA